MPDKISQQAHRVETHGVQFPGYLKAIIGKGLGRLQEIPQVGKRRAGKTAPLSRQAAATSSRPEALISPRNSRVPGSA